MKSNLKQWGRPDGNAASSPAGGSAARRAGAILDAWEHRGADDLACELNRTLAFCVAPACSSGEAERRDLLAAVAAELKASPAGQLTDGSRVCLELLRHLSRPQASRADAATDPRRRKLSPCRRRQPVRMASAFAGASMHSST